MYSDGSIPAGTYDGVEQDVPSIVVPNYLVANESMDEQLAFDLTKLLFDHKKDLVAVHPEAKNLDPRKARQVIAPIELHPGAKRYFDETGA